MWIGDHSPQVDRLESEAGGSIGSISLEGMWTRPADLGSSPWAATSVTAARPREMDRILMATKYFSVNRCEEKEEGVVDRDVERRRG